MIKAIVFEEVEKLFDETNKLEKITLLKDDTVFEFEHCVIDKHIINRIIHDDDHTCQEAYDAYKILKEAGYVE